MQEWEGEHDGRNKGTRRDKAEAKDSRRKTQRGKSRDWNDTRGGADKRVTEGKRRHRALTATRRRVATRMKRRRKTVKRRETTRATRRKTEEIDLNRNADGKSRKEAAMRKKAAETT
jgi:hypothetical protein